MASKSMVVATFAVFLLAVFGSMSVVGLLQSNERIGSSGIVTRPAPPPLPLTSSPPRPSPPPPEPRIEIDVYSDSACTQPMLNVNWGSIEAGSSVNRVLYVKNSGDDTVTLSLYTDNWDPAGAEDELYLSWDYVGGALDSGAILKVTLTLSVDKSSNDINDFSFDIIITGSAS